MTQFFFTFQQNFELVHIRLGTRLALIQRKRWHRAVADCLGTPHVVQFFLDVKNDALARITEPSNDDYDNDVSDNCDNNFGTFDDFGVKNDQKVSHNMILLSKYKGLHGGKKGKKIRAGASPPPFSAMPERKHFFLQEGFPYA